MTEAEIYTPEKYTDAPVANRADGRRRRRVLMVGMHLTKTRGGISTVTKEILRSSLVDDFEFEYIASQAEDFGKFAKARLAVQSILRFINQCLRHPPAMVYVHLGSNASLYREPLFIVLAKIFGRKTIAHFHAGDFDNYYPRQSFIGQDFIRWAIGLSDELIAVSAESGRRLSELVGAPERVKIVPNGIETRDFDFPPLKNKDQIVRLLFVGAIGKLKGESDLIRALQILKKRGAVDLKVSMLGYGAENLQSSFDEVGIGDWVEFIGAVALERRGEFYRNADVFVLPTYGEAMSMSIIEAMAAGLPIVSTDVGGNPELVENGVNGWLVAAGDAESLADKIEFFVKDETARKRFGASGKSKAQEKFDISVCIEKLRELMFDVEVKR